MKKRELLDMIAELEGRVTALELDAAHEECPGGPEWQDDKAIMLERLDQFRRSVPIDVYLAGVPSNVMCDHLRKRNVPRREIDTRKTEMPKVVDGKVEF